MRTPCQHLGVALLLILLSGFVRGQAPQRPDPVYSVADWNGRSVVANRLLVAFDQNVSPSARSAVHAAAGVGAPQVVSRDLHAVTLLEGRDLDQAMAQYAGRAGVRAVLPDVLVAPLDVPDDSHWNLQWALPKVRAPAGWDVATGDPDCVVAIIDSGVDTTHPDLDGHYAWGYDFYADDADPADVNGHGTHCAGIAAAETDNALGIAGAARGSRFAAYRAGNSSFPTSALVASIDDAVAQGAHVLSMSWGSAYNNVLIRFALEDAADAGCVLVAAAGNDGVSSKFYPAALPDVIAVASSSPSDGRSSFSNFGSWVSLAAPGQGIWSAAPGGGYTYKSGTSMACPLVSGMAALLYGRLGGTRSPANAAAVRAALEDSAVDVGTWVAHGRVDLPGALASLASPEPAVLSGLSPGSAQAFGGELLMLTGSGFTGVDTVLVGDAAAGDLTLVDDGTLTAVVPPQTALGAQLVRVVKGGASSAALTLQVLATHPPRLTAEPSTVAVGEQLTLRLGGGPAHAWLLLADLAGNTFPFRGSQLLFPFKILTSGSLDGVGLAQLDLHAGPAVAGLSLHVQVATLQNGGFVGTSEVRHLQVEP